MRVTESNGKLCDDNGEVCDFMLEYQEEYVINFQEPTDDMVIDKSIELYKLTMELFKDKARQLLPNRGFRECDIKISVLPDLDMTKLQVKGTCLVFKN